MSVRLPPLVQLCDFTHG